MIEADVGQILESLRSALPGKGSDQNTDELQRSAREGMVLDASLTPAPGNPGGGSPRLASDIGDD